MRLTPIDIQQQQFRRTSFGFDRREVQSFLQLIAEQQMELTRENGDMHHEVRRIGRELAEYREREATLKQAMLTAQRAIDEMREQARKEAQLIVSEAELRAERIVHSAHARANRILDDLAELKTQRTRAMEEMRHVLATHQKLLEVHDDAIAAEVSDPASITVLDRVRPPAPPVVEEQVDDTMLLTAVSQP